MTERSEDEQVGDDLLAPEDSGVDATGDEDDAPGIHGEEHFGLTPPG